MKFFPASNCAVSECPQPSKNANINQIQNDGLPSLATGVMSPDDHNHPESASIRNHILVVDDDAGVREVLANLLRRSGYQVSCASNGEAGWEALCANSYDALVTDHAMPRLTGLELLRRVRAGTLSALPVILISGKMPWEEADLLDLVWPGMAMEKPFSFFELLTSVRTVLAITTRAESVYDGQAIRVFDRNQVPPPTAVWQDDAPTRLPVRRLVRAG
jgi:DNA-binding response OmpR family regulator